MLTMKFARCTLLQIILYHTLSRKARKTGSSLALHLRFTELGLCGTDTVMAEEVAGEGRKVLLTGPKHRHCIAFRFVLPEKRVQLFLLFLVCLICVSHPDSHQFFPIIHLDPQECIDLLCFLPIVSTKKIALYRFTEFSAIFAGHSPEIQSLTLPG